MSAVLHPPGLVGRGGGVQAIASIQLVEGPLRPQYVPLNWSLIKVSFGFPAGDLDCQMHDQLAVLAAQQVQVVGRFGDWGQG